MEDTIRLVLEVLTGLTLVQQFWSRFKWKKVARTVIRGLDDALDELDQAEGEKAKQKIRAEAEKTGAQKQLHAEVKKIRSEKRTP